MATGQPKGQITTGPRGGSIARRREIGQSRRDKTRRRLLTAAARLVAARGTEGLTIEDFIREAGVSRGTFYNYFDTRDALIAALWAYLGDTPLRAFATAHAADPDPAYRLTTGLRMAINKAADDPVWGWLLFRITGSDPVLNQELRSFSMFDIRAGIDQGRFACPDAEIACDYFVGVSMMAIKAILLGERPDDYGEVCSHLILKGLGLPDEEAFRVARRPLPVMPVP